MTTMTIPMTTMTIPRPQRAHVLLFGIALMLVAADGCGGTSGHFVGGARKFTNIELAEGK